MSALESVRSTLRAALFGVQYKARTERATLEEAPAKLGGGCFRGFVWALIFEAAAIGLVAFLLFEWQYLRT